MTKKGSSLKPAHTWGKKKTKGKVFGCWGAKPPKMRGKGRVTSKEKREFRLLRKQKKQKLD